MDLWPGRSGGSGLTDSSVLVEMELAPVCVAVFEAQRQASLVRILHADTRGFDRL